MSSIPTKQIDGDVALGRDVSIGGKATVRGSATVGHNLTVEGWLEAKNIKGPNKGLFKTEEQLRTAYPNPHDGWWALVAVEGSATADEPNLGQLFMADGGTWVAQVDSNGKPLYKGNPTIDSTEYLEAVEQMTADLDAVKVDVSQNASDIKSLRSTQTTQGDSINSLSEKVTQAQSDITANAGSIATAESNIKAVEGDVAAIEASKGAADGIAPLGADGKIPADYMPQYVDDVLVFAGLKSGITAQQSAVAKKSTDEGCSVVYNSDTNLFVLEVVTAGEDGTQTTLYYSTWDDADLFGDGTDTCTPHSGKIFIDKADNKSYHWKDNSLVVLSSDLALGHEATNAFPGDEGATLQGNVSTLQETTTGLLSLFDDNLQETLLRGVINADILLNLSQRAVTFSVVLEKIYDLTDKSRYVVPGVVVTYYTESGWQSKQWTNFGSQGETEWKNEANWTDFGANGTSVGNILNVNVLCGDTEYSLGTAIKAVQDLETESGMSYFTTGIVLTFRTAELNNSGLKTWKAYQFIADATSVNPADEKPWVEFGGGGSSAVATVAEPAKDSQEPFNAGGAYTYIPTTLAVDTETEGVVKLAMKNAEGDDVGDTVQFAVGTGSGGATGTVVSIQFEESPFYTKAGGSVILKASIRSITKLSSSEEQDNAISECVIKNRDTGATMQTYKVNQKSSASSDTYDFLFDISDYFVNATSMRLQLVATDDAGNTGSRNVNVSGVDVTITSTQTLNWTKNTALEAGGKSKNLPMYKFANNASDKGIKAITEIYLNGEWQTLGTATVTDTYSHTVSINPSNCLEQVLTHGAYPLRIHGEDVASGVVGNYLHTAVMVVEDGNTAPIVVSRWYTDAANGVKKLYETIDIEYAVYESASQESSVSIYYDGEEESTSTAYRTQTNKFTKQVLDSVYDGSKSVTVKFTSGSSTSQESTFVISGSLVDVQEVTDQREFNITMDSRNNLETDHTIKDGNVTITTTGCNWSTTGFVKDSYGTSTYNTDSDTGRMALRIAEDMTAECSYQPFSSTSIEQNGAALSFTVKVKNIEDSSAKLIDCMLTENLGFYLNGERLVFQCQGAKDAVALYSTDKETRFDIVIEPSSMAPYSGIGSIKIYMNGDEAAATYYSAGGLETNHATIKFDGTKADLYLYRITGWATWYNFRQAFNNYLVGMKDTSEMMAEYEKNNVMESQTAEGTTKDRPTQTACREAGLCTVTLLKNANTEDIAQSYPGYLDTLDGDKKTKAYFDVVVRFPDRPWQDFKAYNVPVTNQGTTSSMRPIKNKKLKLKGCTIELLHTGDDFKDNAEQLAKYNACLKNAKKSKIQVIDGGLWVKTICVKVDYSDSTGANNGATMEMMNKMQRALGDNYMTPAQVFYTGEGTMNTSVDSVSAALFRTDSLSVDATDENSAYFHAKANFNVDKGNPDFFGFEKVDGYTGSCLNYGDFVEMVAAKDQTLADFKTATLADTSALNASEIYMLSEYCGPDHVFLQNDGTGKMTETTEVADATEAGKTLAEVLADSVDNYDMGTVYVTTDGKYAKYTGGNWVDKTGKFEYDANTKKWTTSGLVLNPTECFEYLKYDSFCWLQGVNSADDMMAASSESDATPIWMQYYESRYPDDDDLNALYEAGKKVPYNLYKWLEWAQQCNHTLDETAGSITLDGSTVEGTKANRLQKWEHELWEHANVYSTGCYVVASDYILAVDQRSKNMMVAFYKDTTNKIRAYFNHWYDGDCTWLADNDCGLTVPWDLDSKDDPKQYYQGWNSVMFKQCYAADKFWTSANGASTTTLHDIANDMRTATADNINVFSAAACEKYWITDRIAKYAKVTSSFDGERKYIENSTSGSNYYFAVHGLRQEDLPNTFKKRFSFRDGFFQVGDLYSNPFAMRAVGTDIKITITAAQDGFFGLGVDRASECTDSCYLKAGESYTLKSNATFSGNGTMLYVFGASKLSGLDISGCTPSQQGFDIKYCTLLQELIIGGESYTPQEITVGAITGLELGNMSFLRKLDIRNTTIKTVTATYCPRLKEVLADGSALQSMNIAENAPIETLQLPDTMTTLYFKNLPKLTYPGGLTIAGMGNVEKLFLDSCPKIDTMELLRQITNAGSLKSVRIPGVNATASVTMLTAIKEKGAIGIDQDGTAYDETGKCSGITGRWILEELIEDSELKALQDYFPELEVINSQYSYVIFDDSMDDSQNITNPANGTTGDDYEPTDHFVQIDKKCHVYKCEYITKDADNPYMECTQLSDENYNYLADGNTFDTSSSQEDCEVMKRLVPYWYKGVNDFKNQKKYFFVSSLEAEPKSTAEKCTRTKLADCLVQAYSGIYVDELSAGDTYAISGGIDSASVYSVDVEGMKQVRWPGVQSNKLGSVFVDADGKVISTFNMYNGSAQFDFVLGDYVFCDVPTGAKTFVFTAPVGYDDLECIAVDSEALEAIEPDWVHTADRLVGVYGMAVDNINRARSVSGRTTTRGDGTTRTHTGWKYDSAGCVTNTDLASLATNMHYTYKDIINLCEARGKGFQAIDYEMSKDIANLVMALVGDRDIQAQCGQGCSASYTTGSTPGNANTFGNTTQKNISSGNIIFGLQNFVACMYEWCDNVAVNVASFAAFKKNKCVSGTGDTVDHIWHIYDPLTGTERTVQGLRSSNSGYCIGRVKFGRYADIIPSKVTSDKSSWNMNYTDAFYYSESKGRVLGRASFNANANGGLVCASAYNDSSYSYSNYGSRLAFNGKIVIK